MALPSKHGGKREGAGRKSKADELALIEKMDAILAPESVWKAVAAKVSEGDMQASKLWLSYRYGQPQAFTELSGNVEITNIPCVQFIDSGTSEV